MKLDNYFMRIYATNFTFNTNTPFLLFFYLKIKKKFKCKINSIYTCLKCYQINFKSILLYIHTIHYTLIKVSIVSLEKNKFLNIYIPCSLQFQYIWIKLILYQFTENGILHFINIKKIYYKNFL
ncbi:hypothetical protein EDEG_02462 [Edhazardia aedis USNM 41457]|uniref:Uncharacterized protein n=1 Tax=Edhazardia aedis (strain USNM 41457) TaxID=1003232 RepID=J9DP94_EDHAE|nr:hypothetical protein EDEG_02462 [Edhazardia aedis USNM 41457]|eukprot:EJW03157.1 hypothetical protein EDEG_02462 [Edhazardia aedis USNM 41457]